MSDIYTDFKSIHVNEIFNATKEQLSSISSMVRNNAELVNRAIRMGFGGRTVSNYQNSSDKQVAALDNRLEQQKKIDEILNKIQHQQVNVPAWFVNNNVNWFLKGEITAGDFLNGWNNLIQSNEVQTATPEPMPEPTPEPIPTPAPVTVTPESTSWYWIKKPSGQIEYVKISEKLKQVYLDKGYIVSRSKIEEPQPAPTPQPTPEPQPQPTPAPVPVESPLVTEPEPVIIEEPIVTATPIIMPTVDDSINTGMVTQQVIDFNIINGRAVGSIKFVATSSFNPYYYNKDIINLVQFKTPNGVTLLVKQNRLRFTQTERDEIIHYDESVQENTRVTVESFVWEWIDKPAGAFSNKYIIDISEAEPPKPMQAGFMGAGVAGAIAGLILLGFVADHKRAK